MVGSRRAFTYTALANIRMVGHYTQWEKLGASPEMVGGEALEEIQRRLAGAPVDIKSYYAGFARPRAHLRGEFLRNSRALGHAKARHYLELRCRHLPCQALTDMDFILLCSNACFQTGTSCIPNVFKSDAPYIPLSLEQLTVWKPGRAKALVPSSTSKISRS